MLKALSLFFVSLSILAHTTHASVEKWDEKSITKYDFTKLTCYEEMDGNHGGYFIYFPKDSYTSYLMLYIDKSDDTEHVIGGYDPRIDGFEVKTVKRNKKVNGKWKEVSTKVLSTTTTTAGLSVEINLKDLLELVNSTEPRGYFAEAQFIYPIGNIQSFTMKCELR